MTYKSEFGDYDAMYGGLDYEGAVVLDVGADYGSTARYFLERGASQVYASEKNPKFVERLIAWVDGPESPPVAVLLPMNANLAERWLRDIRPDLVKMDCEKCERFLLEVPDDLLAGPRGWVIETHTRELYDDLRALFRRLGYEVTTVEEFFMNKPERCIKVIAAVRHD